MTPSSARPAPEALGDAAMPAEDTRLFTGGDELYVARLVALDAAKPTEALRVVAQTERGLHGVARAGSVEQEAR